MIALYTATIFLSAALLFAVQPLLARLLLPLLGGAPAVWNTCLVFFQATLLAGYGYAHLLNRWVRPARQVWVHGAVLLVALVSLPIAIPAGWTPPVDRNPILWLLAAAAVAVGLPFFVVSATSPLLQRWFAATDHPAAGDPYFLYAASNLGSLVALVGYPLWIEPHLGLRQQSWWWAAGYGVLGVLIAGCADAVLRRAATAPARGARKIATETGVPPTWRRRGRWLLLALVPSSLMLSVTSYLTADIAAVPLLWVIPLAIYLASFILVFARWTVLPHRWVVRAFPYAVALLVFALLARAQRPIGLIFAMHLVALFVVSLVCHGEIARDRPPPRFLTGFYLWMAVGGVLGGVFNALVAPVVFTAVVEYPITLVLACLLVRGRPGAIQRSDVTIPVLVGLATAVLTLGLRTGVLDLVWLSFALMFGVPPVLCFALRERPVRFGLGVAAVLWAGAWAQGDRARLLHAERSFFGVHRVYIDVARESHRLLHGNTVHGAQRLDPARRREPVWYYAPSGPVGQLLTALGEARRQEVGLVGLGAGELLCYASAGQHWTYYEIDPAVERIARDPRWFTYLPDCPATVDVVLGDARLRLQDAPDKLYRMIILDAYNSDAIPLHLLTREALRMYLEKLRPDGLLVWHITNRHIDLEPVIAALARDAGLACLMQDEPRIGPEESAAGRAPSRWAVVARDAAQFGPLARDPRWQPARERPGLGVWTDDYANLFGVLKPLWAPPASRR